LVNVYLLLILLSHILVVPSLVEGALFLFTDERNEETENQSQKEVDTHT